MISWRPSMSTMQGRLPNLRRMRPTLPRRGELKGDDLASVQRILDDRGLPGGSVNLA